MNQIIIKNAIQCSLTYLPNFYVITDDISQAKDIIRRALKKLCISGQIITVFIRNFAGVNMSNYFLLNAPNRIVLVNLIRIKVFSAPPKMFISFLCNKINEIDIRRDIHFSFYIVYYTCTQLLSQD